MADELNELNPEAAGLEDVESRSDEASSTDSLAMLVEERFQKAKRARREKEQKWLTAYRNYKGEYGPEVQFSDAEKSRTFIKVTKTKVLAAYAQLCDVLFGGGKFPLTISATRMPMGISGLVHYDPLEKQDEGTASPYGFKGDGADLAPGATEKTLLLGAYEQQLEGKDVKEGPGRTDTSVEFNPAEYAAAKMQRKIYDQLEESNGSKVLRQAAFECCLYGTGILKGPTAYNKEYPKWDETGTYTPEERLVPKVGHTSVWDFYPDPDAMNMDDAGWAVEHHRLTRSGMRDLKKRPFFRAEVIEDVITGGENYVREDWESVVRDNTQATVERFSVKEYWGTMDVSDLETQDIDIPDSLKERDELSVNIWVSGGRVLRAVLNPFQPTRHVHCAIPFEIDPHSLFGVGLAENMEDTQSLMNGFMRLAIDNARLSGNMLIEIDETNLVPGQNTEIYPGKVFRRQSGAPGQAIFGTKFPNVANENLQLFDKARQLADESTGLPSFSHGQTGVSGIGRTSGGISMLMNAAASGMKNVVKNFDDYGLLPLGRGLFFFNMQFDFDEEIKGDLEVKARGTESFMANEVRSQRLLQFLQIGSNPAIAPWMKAQHIIREVAKSMELDPDEVTNDLQEAKAQAALQQQMGGPTAAPAKGQLGPMGEAGGGAAMGATPPAMPGEQGFSGNEQPQQPEGPM